MSYYSSPRWSHELPDCSMPMTFDTYSKCSYKCAYCFSQYQKAIGQGKKQYLEGGAKSVNVETIKRLFTDPGSVCKALQQFAPYIQQRRIMQWGGLADQFDEYERKHGKTLELLRFFKSIDYPLCFSTKATWWTKDERYMELFRGQKNWNVKFSIITLDEEKARKIEAGVPSPEERLEAIRRIAEANAGGATLRLRPFIIGISTPGYEELIHRAGENGATALSTEFFCLEQRSTMLARKMPLFNALCGFDVMAFYRKYSPATAGYLRLCRAVKKPFIEKMKAACDAAGMRFYVSDAHFKECCANGSCCGLPESWNYSRGQFTEALQIAKKRGRVYWNDIAADVESLHAKIPWGKAEGLNCNSSEQRAKLDGMTVAGWLHWLWNSPQSGNSPARIFGGVLRWDGKDENGNAVYAYDPTKSI